MASRTDTFMYLDLEFYDAESFGFINFYNNAEEGENLAGGTVGFGNVAERRIGFYGTEHVDTFEIKDFDNIEVHNYTEENNEITGYHNSQFIVKANSFKLTLENPDEVATINLNTDTFNDYIKFESYVINEGEEDEEEIPEENWSLSNPSGMLFKSSNSLGFANTSNLMLGIMDFIDKEFTWVGRVYAEDFFNLDGVKVSYEGHTHDNHYTKTESDERYYSKTELDNGQLDDRYYTQDEVIDEIEIRGEGPPNYKESGYFIYSADNNEWSKIEYIKVDEQYDIPDDVDDGFWYAEKEEKLYEKREGSLYTPSIEQEVENVENLPAPKEGDRAYTTRYGRYYEYTDDSWQRISPDEEKKIIRETEHKSDIDPTTTAEGDIFHITSTDKYYEYLDSEFIEIIKPHFIYYRGSDLPTKPNDGTIYYVKGGTFYMFNGSSWVEIERPLKIPEIHYDNIDKYQSQDKIVFVTRRK
ncbi:MAG: hypothetical protein ACOCRO_03620 [Halanaerobiales bacterium]